MNYDEATLQEIRQKITENTERITSLVNKMLELSDAKSHTVMECHDEVPVAQIATEAINMSGIEKSPSPFLPSHGVAKH